MRGGRNLSMAGLGLVLAALFVVRLLGHPPPQEDEEGRGIVQKACLQCHSLRPLTMSWGDRGHWQGIIYEMISHGAQVLPQEIDPLARYLARNFGEAPQETSSQKTAGEASATLPAGEGRSAVLAACVGCHDLNQAVALRGDEAAWGSVVDRMIQYGAQLPEADRAGVVGYLARNFGPDATSLTSASSPAGASQADDEGARLLGVACLQCHSLRPLSMVHGGREEWERIVYEMISHGAQIAPSEIDPILDYLTRTYPSGR